jgi:quercetin dioxygenase-like cupin family protein
VEIRRFGVGNRRPDGPAGSFGVTGQTIHTDERAVISELAFTTRASIEAHSNPNTAWFIVIEGGGFVGVGDERARVAAGEAVLWPADLIHRAWTDGSHMRAIVVELAGEGAAIRGLLEAGDRSARPLAGSAADQPPVARGEGSLANSTPDPTHDPEAGEPL